MSAHDPIQLASYLAAGGDQSIQVSSDILVCDQALAALEQLSASNHLSRHRALQIATVFPRVCQALYHKNLTADLQAWARLAAACGRVFRELCTRFKSMASSKTERVATSGDQESDQVDTAMASFLDTMLAVLEASTSRRAAENMLPAWRDATRIASTSFSLTKGSHGPIFKSTAQRLAWRLLDTYIRHSCVAPQDLCPEFFDVEEDNAHIAAMRAGVAQLATVCAELDPIGVCQGMDTRLRGLLAQASEPALQQLHGNCLVLERLVDAVVVMVSTNTNQTEKSNIAALQALDEGLIPALVSFRPLDEQWQLVRLNLFDSVRSVLAARSSYQVLGQVLTELFIYLEHGNTANIRRRSAQSLLRLAKVAPTGLVNHLDALRNSAATLLASGSLCHVATQQLCESLVLVSNQCQDVSVRTGLLRAVLAAPLAKLDAAQAQLSSASGFLKALGVLSADNQLRLTEDAKLKKNEYKFNVDDDEERHSDDEKDTEAESLRHALSALLAIARRAAQSQNCQLPEKPLCAPPVVPPYLEALTTADAGAAVLQRAMPTVLTITLTLHALWAPPVVDALKSHPIARLVLAPSLDEIRAKLEPPGPSTPRSSDENQSTFAKSKTTAVNSNTKSGITASKENYLEEATMPPEHGSLAARWASTLNEIRSCVYQLARLWVERQCAFAPDAAPQTAELFKACGGLWSEDENVSLWSLENRHLASLLKHVLEPLVLRCPPLLYSSHLAPITRRLALHLESRLQVAWSQPEGDQVYMEDFDQATRSACGDAIRRELTRSYLDVLQIAMATKGELAAPPVKQNRTSNGDDGENGRRIAAARERRAAHVTALREFVLGNVEQLALPILRTLRLALAVWGDVPSCRAATRIAQVFIGAAHDRPQYYEPLATLFAAAVGALVEEPSWLANAGCEYELLSLARAVYVGLVLAVDPNAIPRRVQIVPPRHTGPRDLLLSLPGVQPHHVQTLEQTLRQPSSVKDQRSAIQDVIAIALEAKDSTIKLLSMTPPSVTGDASALRDSVSSVRDLPGKIPGSRQIARHQRVATEENFNFTSQSNTCTNLADLFEQS
eukprot:CAMPEP_0197295958 /NCGR_PEP_ID=MMETSP0890-20130614/37097_1 /TAXON_ID=44058 ORGANISM="Aureoumbra lagunensis, Strain CCMP1510" /NCGR_SAMPLE_ID=MMETSP0890 /ASSEMBLY_ACC=CAM_ASM_000533 /LENGTH=1069 /DNA_ID=CAMNT_0042772225 /DNA_START=763 /DNA_END=3972 /DNA_ORIENTATION=+